MKKDFNDNPIENISGAAQIAGCASCGTLGCCPNPGKCMQCGDCGLVCRGNDPPAPVPVPTSETE